MKRPASVKVGAHTYKFHYIQLGTHVGECLTTKKVIKIDKFLDGSYLVETILHETMHAIWYEWGIKNSEQSDSAFAAGVTTEEHAINGLANGLMAVFRDNPKFRAFIYGGCK